jgi:hypothetical protein
MMKTLFEIVFLFYLQHQSLILCANIEQLCQYWPGSNSELELGQSCLLV